MRYISLFSGVEAASVAWAPLGWEPVAFCEIDKFPSAVLAERFPHVPNLGDITKVDWRAYAGSADIVVGGSPCQSFSVAGKREGLKGASGLMFEYIRAVSEIMPTCFVWENVPGALSSEHGAAFGQLLAEMDGLGYGLAWRVLDAQFFGVAQRRRRVFLVGCLGDPERAAEILFDGDSLRWGHPSSRDKRQELAGAAGAGAGGCCGCLTPWDTQSRRVYGADGAYPTLDARPGKAGQDGRAVLMGLHTIAFDTTQITSPQNGNRPQVDDPCHPLCAGAHAPAVAIGFSAGQSSKAGSVASAKELAPTLRGGSSGTNQVPTACIGFSGNVSGSRGFASSEELSPTLRAGESPTSNAPCVCMASGQANAEIGQDLCPAQAARQYKDPPIVVYTADGMQAVFHDGLYWVVRRLMPVECERLQGFPDDWTRIPWRGKPAEECPDGPRYKAMGNSMAVPVMRWIGERIEETA